jgi:hypothetical protein
VFEKRIKEGWGAFAVSDKLVVSLMVPPAYRKYGKPYYRVSVHALIGFRGSYTPALSEKRNSFLRLLKKKG